MRLTHQVFHILFFLIKISGIWKLAEIYGGRKQLQIHSTTDRDEESLGPVKDIRKKNIDKHYSKYVKRENYNFTYLK